ncbi:hypothetical protein ACWD62_34715 [Streptomyces sp. NPDC005146]
MLAKTLRDYKRLGEYVGMARRSGRIPWSAMRDDKQVAAEAPPSFTGTEHFWRTVDAIARDYRVDRQHGQLVWLELWSETEGMIPQLARVGEEFGISCYSGGGFGGLAGKHDAAERAIADGKRTCILHIGDYDASGEWILTARRTSPRSPRRPPPKSSSYASRSPPSRLRPTTCRPPAERHRPPRVLRLHHHPGRGADPQRPGRDRARGDRGPP